MENQIQLIERDGRLYSKREDIVDMDLIIFISGDNLLMVHYEAGDCDTIKWPDPDVEHLREALFDCRETGCIPIDTKSALLPDSTEIEF